MQAGIRLLLGNLKYITSSMLKLLAIVVVLYILYRLRNKRAKEKAYLRRKEREIRREVEQEMLNKYNKK